MLRRVSGQQRHDIEIQDNIKAGLPNIRETYKPRSMYQGGSKWNGPKRQFTETTIMVLMHAALLPKLARQRTKTHMSRHVKMANRSKDQKVGMCPKDNPRSQKMTDSSGTARSGKKHQILVVSTDNLIGPDPTECGHVEWPKGRIEYLSQI